MLKITDAAAKEVKKIISDQELDTNKMFLRLGIKGGGCSGFEFTLDLSSEKSDNDEVFESNGISIIVDPISIIYLNGTTVDFKDSLMERGFIFDNPNSTGKCGCGSSFSV